MKSKLATFIISIVIILLLAVFGLVGMIIWKEFEKIQTSIEPENTKTIFSSNENTIDQNIKAPNVGQNPFDQIQGEGKEVDYSNISIDNYFYDQLEDESKRIYQAFESKKEEMKTGTYKVELGSSFSDLLKTSNGQDVLGTYYQSAIEAYTYDNPDVFYLSPNKMYLNIETTTKGRNTTYYVYVDNGKESNYLIDEFQSKEQVEEALGKIEQIKNDIMQKRSRNTEQTIKMVHDYLVDNVSYDTSISEPNIYNMYGAFVNKKAVCEGYARAFKYMMDHLGIPCTLVIGKGTNSEGKTENHAWNYVQLNGIWYAIDTTWDDPVVTNGGWVSQSSKYKYFLKGANDFSKDHTPSPQFTQGGKIFSYPDLSNNNYK